MEAVETENKLKEQLIFLIDKLSTTSLSENEFTKLLQNKNLVLQYAQNKANKIRQENFSNKYGNIRNKIY